MKLLLVEDDRAIAQHLKEGLGVEGFTVDVATDGAEGWWMATEIAYEVIVLDILLPRRNGFELCRDLRTAGNWTPVVMLTAKVGELDEIEALGYGADDYLTKPFSFPILVARLRSVVRRVQRRTLVPMSVGSLRADSVSRRVWADGEEVELTTREFDVLEFLLRRPGQVVSKREILDGVWEFDFDGDPNIVEVYVARLRRKISRLLDGDVIGTVRGAGYRIDAHAA